jgi:hypothetical protein
MSEIERLNVETVKLLTDILLPPDTEFTIELERKETMQFWYSKTGVLEYNNPIVQK